MFFMRENTGHNYPYEVGLTYTKINKTTNILVKINVKC